LLRWETGVHEAAGLGAGEGSEYVESVEKNPSRKESCREDLVLGRPPAVEPGWNGIQTSLLSVCRGSIGSLRMSTTVWIVQMVCGKLRRPEKRS
jgi:hypothetical protein